MSGHLKGDRRTDKTLSFPFTLGAMIRGLVDATLVAVVAPPSGGEGLGVRILVGQEPERSRIARDLASRLRPDDG